MPRGRRTSRIAAAAVLTALATAGCGPVGAVSGSSPTASGPTAAPASRAAAPSRATQPAAGGVALAAARALTVKGRAPRTGYDRALFGAAWTDTDRNGCDTRNDVLRRDLTAVVLKPGTHGCVVLRGHLADPYTGRAIDFVRGPGSAKVQIDHVVALSDAWQKGAQQWTVQRRTAFANDPLNLLAVDGPTNQGKGDGDTATWLPPRKAFRCTYVARQVAVKRRYGVWVTAAEKAAMVRVLSGCPGQRLPTASVTGSG